MSKNTPELRFPEFTGEWERKKLGEIAEKVNSGKTPLGGESVYSDNGILFIRSQNVNNNRLSYDNSTFISAEINNTMKNSIVKPKDILLNITGASLGRSCVVPETFTTGNVNQHVCIIRIDNNNEPYFIQPIFASENGQQLFTSLQTGSGREGLNFQSIRHISLYLPSLPEQQKIATFLSAIDDKLQALKKKKALLEQYKKGVMQSIFSQQIRFKDDNGEDYPKWEMKKLREVAKIMYGKDQKQISDVNGRYPILGTGGLMGKTNHFLYDKPSVLIGRKGTIDKPYFMDTPFWTVDTLFYTEILDIASPKWLYYKFQTINWYLYNEASGVPSLSASTINKIVIILPSLPEQTKIANFLTSIDEKLTQCQAQIEQTDRYKKGLLQKMFC